MKGRRINTIKVGCMALLLSSSWYLPGCSSRIALNSDRLISKQTVTLTMKNGGDVTGEIRDINDGQIIIVDDEGQSWAADKSKIVKIYGPAPVFDNHNRIISEREIKVNKNNNNFWLFTISGGLVSAGCGFFLSSMLSRTDDENRDTIILTGTSLTTVAGSYFFSRLGMKKDRQQAIKKIRYLRELDEQYISEEERKRRDIERELEQLKKERQQQEQEIETLRQQIRDKDK
ncbi:hypothetical protein JXO59_01220 [candidate division KSB1 bacterium]|nr:hypothetical protein [candidate division KSB1 bacterium]